MIYLDSDPGEQGKFFQNYHKNWEIMRNAHPSLVSSNCEILLGREQALSAL